MVYTRGILKCIKLKIESILNTKLSNKIKEINQKLFEAKDKKMFLDKLKSILDKIRL
jgi:hypothetical protein